MLLALMLIAVCLAIVLRPTQRIADLGPKINLERMIPKQFVNWKEDANQINQIVNPEQRETLKLIYTQTLSRIYINHLGERIMLTIAYGDEQSEAKQLHYPEICYPAQGFQVSLSKLEVIQTKFGKIRVKRLLATLGNRSEPLTYWTTIGDKVVRGKKETKFEQLRFGFHGLIPDGLLIRVSSITPDIEAGYNKQNIFINDLITALSDKNRLKLTGLL